MEQVKKRRKLMAITNTAPQPLLHSIHRVPNIALYPRLQERPHDALPESCRMILPLIQKHPQQLLAVQYDKLCRHLDQHRIVNRRSPLPRAIGVLVKAPICLEKHNYAVHQNIFIRFSQH
jgi:hypothetical protein